MKRFHTRCWVVLCLAGCAATGHALDWEAAVDAGVYSGYVDRGVQRSDRPVFQPALTLDMGRSFSLSVWGNMDLTNRGERRQEWTEIDLTAAYALPFSGPVGITAGYTETHFPKRDEAIERELFLEFDRAGPVLAVCRLFWNWEEKSAVYVEAGAIYTWPIDSGLNLDMGLWVGLANAAYNEATWAIDSASVNDVNLTTDLEISLSDRVSLTITGQYTFLPDREIRRVARSAFSGDRTALGGFTLRILL